MKKVLYVATVDQHIKAFHLDIINELKQKNYLVDLASNGEYINGDINEKFNIPFSRNPISCDNIKAYSMLKKILSNDYDVIITNTPVASFLVRLANKNNLACKVIYIAHGFHFYTGCPLKNKLIFKTMEKLVAKYTDVILTMNEEDYKSALKFKLRNKGYVKFINGIGVNVGIIKDTLVDKKSKKRELGLDNNVTIYLSVGELNENKNHKFVIDALKDELINNKNLYYVICGCGKLDDYYHDYLIKENLEDKVLFLGFRNDIYELLKIADLFIFPSIREGLPLSIIEAMAANVPIVASNIRGNKDLIHDGINGYLYSVDNKDELINCINKQRTNPLKSNIDVEKYDKTIINKEILGIIDELI